MNPRLRLFGSFAICAVLVWLGACSGTPEISLAEPKAGATDMPSLPSETAVHTQVSITQATSEPTSTQEAEPVVYLPAVMGGWREYIHPLYGFSLLYPPDWSLQEIQDAEHTLSGHAIHLVPDSNPLVRMQIAYKSAGDDMQLTRTGVGSGEIVPKGAVVFLGEPIVRNVLVLEGKDLTVLYGGGEIQRGELAFTIYLDYTGLPTDPTALSAELEAVVDQIVASVKVQEPARVVSEQDSGGTVRLKVDDLLTVELEGNPSTGYSWEVMPADNPVLEQVGEAAYASSSDLLGAPEKVTLHFRARTTGEQMLQLIYDRSWEENVPPEKTFEIAVVVE